MPVRHLDGTDDTIYCDVGDADVVGAWTMAIVLRQPLAAYGVVYQAHSPSDSADGYGFQVTQPGGLQVYSGPSENNNYVEVTSDVGFLVPGRWQLVTVSKDSGTVPVRFRSYDLATRTLQNEGEGNKDLPDCVSIGSGGYLAFGSWEADYHYPGDIAAAAIWDQALAESAIDRLASVNALVDWAGIEDPRALWLFDQASTSTPVQDLIGAADQNSIAGTDVVLEEPPIPYRAVTVGYRGPGGWLDRPLSVYGPAGWSSPSSLEVL